jgi:hypothetical protein
VKASPKPGGPATESVSAPVLNQRSKNANTTTTVLKP